MDWIGVILWNFLLGVTIFCISAVVIVTLAALMTLYLYYRSCYRYFQMRGIPYEPGTFPFGIYTGPILNSRSLSLTLADLYEKYREGVVGFFTLWRRNVLIRDPVVIERILMRDFDNFDHRGHFCDTDKEPLTGNLVSVSRDDWFYLRDILEPTFADRHMTELHPLVVSCTDRLEQQVETMHTPGRTQELQEVLFNYSVEVISDVAYGFECEALTNRNSTFLKMVKKVLQPTIKRLLISLLTLNAHLCNFMNFQIIPKTVQLYFITLFTSELLLRESGKRRPDYVQILHTIQRVNQIEYEPWTLTDDKLAAQAFAFIVAGCENITSTISFCLLELARNPDIQDRLYQNLTQLPDLSYESIQACQYLDMVVKETLRKHPTLGFIQRQCLEDYYLPHHDVIIESNTQVFISVEGLHHDPHLFPRPQQFDPERFSQENIANIRDFSYLPFGMGGRYCIGMNFAKMVVKTAVVALLRRYKFDMLRYDLETPVQTSSQSLFTSIDGGLWLKLERRL